MRLFLSLFISAILVCSCKRQEDKAIVKPTLDKLPYFIASDFTPQWLTASELEGKHKISPFSFINQNGDTITNDTYKGKIYVADFFFTICPGICPKLTKNMNLIQETYKNDSDIKLLSHTVMPWHDSVPVLKEYAIKNTIDDRKWNLVTGDKDEIYTIAREGYFADEDFIKTQDENSFIHTENFILVDTQGYIRGVYNGTIPLDVKRLMRHIEILKKERL
ncbi:SCO family protein [Aquimarina megaterium]|uniref:SCO family protein n=1 Tax=Aquimarina megaterium TaxID=1443666 RepID=UPI000557186D|nr:SCO family protein [Aquimarina megaterium]